MARELADLVDNYTASRRSRALWHLGREASLERAALKHAIGPRCCGTGSSSIGAESFTTLTPTVFLSKGFGSLPDSMKFFRPIAVTAQVGCAIPTESSTRES